MRASLNMRGLTHEQAIVLRMLVTGQPIAVNLGPQRTVASGVIADVVPAPDGGFAVLVDVNVMP